MLTNITTDSFVVQKRLLRKSNMSKLLWTLDLEYAELILYRYPAFPSFIHWSNRKHKVPHCEVLGCVFLSATFVKGCQSKTRLMFTYPGLLQTIIFSFPLRDDNVCPSIFDQDNQPINPSDWPLGAEDLWKIFLACESQWRSLGLARLSYLILD